MMRTIPSESCFVHGLSIVTVTFVCCRGRRRDNKTRSKKISAVVWGGGACELAIGIQICGVSVFSVFCSEIPCWNIRFSPPGARERKVLHHEPFLFLLVDCIIWFGVTATPHKCGNVYARKCTLFLCSPSHYCESSLRRQALHTVLFLETLFGTQKPVWVQNQDGS